MAVTVKITFVWDMTHCRLRKKFRKGMERLSQYSLCYAEDNGIRFLLIIGKHLADYTE
jgi:hypothetical protein